MLSNFFRHDDPFDSLSSRVDDIFAGFEEDRLTRPPRGFFDDFSLGFEDDFWGHRHPMNTNRRRRREQGRGYGGYGGSNDDLRSLVFSMQRQMQDMQRMFEHIEDRLYNPALEDCSGASGLSQSQKQHHQQHLTHSEANANNANNAPAATHTNSSDQTITNPTQNHQPWYKIVKQEKHYMGGSDPSKRSYFVKTEVNDNGHVRVKIAEKKPGEDWNVDTKEYEEPSQRALKREPAQPQGQLKANHPEGEQVQSHMQPQPQSQIKESKETGSDKSAQQK